MSLVKRTSHFSNTNCKTTDFNEVTIAYLCYAQDCLMQGTYLTYLHHAMDMFNTITSHIHIVVN